jgi:hypothetical protein
MEDRNSPEYLRRRAQAYHILNLPIPAPNASPVIDIDDLVIALARKIEALEQALERALHHQHDASKEPKRPAT